MTAGRAGSGIVTGSESETAAAGRRLAVCLKPGDIVILTGSLGAGKTVFVRGLAEGMGIDPRQVHSPSFTILTEYGPSPSGLRLVHVDLYRVDSIAEIEELGLADHFAPDRIIAVEWGEKLPQRLKEGAVGVMLEDAGGEKRRLTVLGASR